MFFLVSLTATAAGTKKKSKADFPPLPKIAPGEYALFLDDKYILFTTQKVDSLEIDSACAKTKPPKCQAFLAKDDHAKALPAPHPQLNHPAALNCQGKGGQNLIALNSQKKEYDFCRFKDNSMVESWSLYFREHPAEKIK